MGKVKKTMICVLIFLIGTGRVHGATFEGHHLATEIDISCQKTQIARSFRQSSNLEEILNHLRLLEYAGMPSSDPEQQKGDTYRLIVHLADGKDHIYHLHADRYLSQDFRPWIKVESKRPLTELLQALPAE